jgi:DNA repair exonuclease SbcCD ATPase subunit
MTELKEKYERSRQEFQEQMGKLLQNQEASSAAKESEAIRSALESDRDRQQSEHQLEVKALREKIGHLDTEMEQVKAQLDAKDVELQGALATLESQQAQLAEKEEKLSSLNQNVTKKEELTRKAKTVEQGATKTLAAFDQFKTQRMSAIREQMKAQLAGLVVTPGATPASAHDARVHSLQEANEKLKTDLKETNASLKQVRGSSLADIPHI